MIARTRKVALFDLSHAVKMDQLGAFSCEILALVEDLWF
jgi:hypothetical protein